ncbi:Zn-ribbon domain-containing OB-fold protein [Leucobacter denitrificans]|uniref:OB-fold domain-containing protein n=1 Tax=Leucobacter denitrificans TaxID=683042 RepID=A0A7G9S532_9MICO|nr:OB-fold domain-containing protein [Leucobacter denitrificans]QNN62957.1 OB-fold domain-containing protein [Leucobacter denitrificans]
MEKPAPVPSTASAFYWEHARKGELVIQGFEGTDFVQFPPNDRAERFDIDTDPIPVPVAGTGTVYSFSVLHQAFHPAFVEDLPLVLALVELDDYPGIRILTNILEANPEDITIGMAVEVVFEERGEYSLPQFRPSQQEVAA